MEILSYKDDNKDYCHVITFQTLTEEQTLKTNDKARDVFLKSVNTLIKTTVAYMKIGGEDHSFSLKTIDFPTATKDGRVSLLMRVPSTNCFAVLTVAGIDNKHVFLSKDLDAIDPGAPKNALLDAIEALYNNCVQFLEGDREQIQIDFEAAKQNAINEKTEQQNLFSGVI